MLVLTGAPSRKFPLRNRRVVSMLATRSLFLMTASILLCAAPAMAQSSRQGVIEIEGPLEAASGENGAKTIKVMGLTVNITPDTKMASPTAPLTYDDLANGPALPGRKDPGFLKGKAIVTGMRDAAGLYAQQVFVEPSEHHLIGTVTKNDEAGFEVEGMPVVLLPSSPSARPYPDKATVSGTPPVVYDARLPGTVLKNAAGFEIVPNSVAVGADIVVAGYHVPSPTGPGTLYAYSATASGDDVSQTPRVSIIRAECRQRAADRIEWDVRGATIPNKGTVTILNSPGTVQYGVATVTADTSDPAKGVYRFRTETKNATQPCPEAVLARYVVGSATYTATASVERR
jgi:hypothetical protein